PITAIKTFNELLRSGAADDADLRAEFLGESQAQIEKLEWITHNLLDLSRLDSGTAQMDIATHDVGELLQAAASTFKQSALEKKVELAVKIPTPALLLKCDRARMEIAVSNLIDNALKFTPTGGAIHVSAESHKGAVRIIVNDNGPGVDQADLPHLFERFYRGKSTVTQGSGLGLALVKSIVTAHHGIVSVESALGHGSAFSIEIPIDMNSHPI
ncbi:MAG TPA: HAMP domain-containing sensor histidine kinase, partial [Anaerolineae bacterium]